MGSFSRIRHGLGLHTGQWVFETPGSCVHTLRCTGCAKVKTRIRHELADWALRLPRDVNACTRERVCRRCAMVETEQVHVFEWYYPDDALPGPGIAEAFTALLDPADPASRCRQLHFCAYCYVTDHGDRTHHEWGTASPTFNGDEEYRCRRCDTTRRTPAPFGSRPGGFPDQNFRKGPGQMPGQGG